MSRRTPATVRNLVDAAKLIFVLSLLLAFGMRRGFAEVQTRLPWLGMTLLALIVLSGGFLLISFLLRRKHRGKKIESGDPGNQSDTSR